MKPNIVDAANPKSGVVTHPKIVEALLKYFQELGKEVVIGEGTGFFNTDEKFEKLINETGYAKLEQTYGIRIENLENTPRVKKKWKYGEIELPKYLETHEYVNLPTMKTHSLTLVTLSLKNQKGLLKFEEKKNFHKTNLQGMIRELAQIAIPRLTVMNAIYCCEGTGPALYGSKPKRMDLLIAGTDQIEVDNVAVRIMGFDPARIPHIPLRPNIDIRGLTIKEVQTPFDPPLPYLQIQNIYVYSDDKGCTSCQMNISRSAQKIFYTSELRDQLAAKGKIDLLVGTHPFPDNPGHTAVCFGDCAKPISEKFHLPLIAGCPPDYHQVIDHLFNNYYKMKR